MNNQHLITHFYTAFQQLKAEEMVACYDADIRFRDPAFGILEGLRANAMWQMLCENAKDLKIEFDSIEADVNKGTAHWQAWYTFSKTGCKVHNSITAKFIFRDGKIISHIDDFNLWRWSRQALGIQGFLLGGTQFFRSRLQAQTNRMLDRYIAK